MAVSSRSKDLSGRSWSVEWQPGDLDSPLIFHRRGTRVGDFRKRWKKACGAAGVSGRLLYDLRRTAIWTMALAGTRPGEALALQAGDVDLANLANAFKRTLKAATPDGQDPPRHSLYDLRHTYATTLLAKRAPITYVAAQMGHANAATTLRYYAHRLPRTGGRYVELLLA